MTMQDQGLGQTTQVFDSNEPSDQDQIPQQAEEATNPFGSSPIGDQQAAAQIVELQEAERFFKKGRVGDVNKYAFPLSKQLQLDTAANFPRDQKYYDSAAKTQTLVFYKYLGLRIGTFALFAITVLLQTFIAISMIPSTGGEDRFASFNFLLRHGAEGAASIFGGPNGSTPLGLGVIAMAVIGLLAYAIRSAARSIIFYNLSVVAERLSFDVFARLDDIGTRVNETAAKARDRVGKGAWSEEDWRDRARNWTRIALWNAKRGEYLDRYITVVIWRVRTYNMLLEKGFIAAKTVVVLGAIWALVTGFAGSANTATIATGLGVSVFLLAQTYFFWHRLGQKPDDFWTKKFRNSASDEAEFEESYVEKISGVVENFVDEIQSKEFGQSTKGK